MISREALLGRVRSEVEKLGADDLEWWSRHQVDPYVVTRDGDPYYAVAWTTGQPLVFFDEKDCFGQHAAEPWKEGLRLYHDLNDAVSRLSTRESLSRMFSETASRLLELGFLDLDDTASMRRALTVLKALGPDAAVAVPRLIEIMGNERPGRGTHRESAICILAEIGPAAAPAVSKLIEIARLDSANARGWSLKAFESIGPGARPAVPLLIDLLLMRVSIDPNPFYVPMAADALGNIGAIAALPALLRVLQETDDPSVASSVVEAIGKLGPLASEAEPVLNLLVEGSAESSRFREDADVREAARAALDRIRRARSVGLE